MVARGELHPSGQCPQKVRGLPFSVKWEKRGHQRGAERAVGGSQAQPHACGDHLELEDLQADTFTPFSASAPPGNSSWTRTLSDLGPWFEDSRTK